MPRSIANYFYNYCASSFFVAILLSCILLTFVVWTDNVPPDVPFSTDPVENFSARRAVVQLERILGNEAPHPAGSKENRQVRLNIQEELRLLGIEQMLQATNACSAQFGKCRDVENVLARIAGRTAEPVVLLMAHYDSAATGSGAGDNGSGVVSLLEIARISARNITLGIATALVSLLILSAVGFFVGYSFSVAIPGHSHVKFSALLLAVAAAVLVTTRYLGEFIRRSLQPEEMLLASWWCWFLVALVTSLGIPRVSLLAVLPSVLLAVYSYFASHASGRHRNILAIIAVVTVTPFSLGTVSTIVTVYRYQSLATWSLPSAAAYMILAMFAITLLPLAGGRQTSSKTARSISL